MLEKPCGYAKCDRRGIVTAKGPKTLAAKQFCSISCGARHRLEHGWKPYLNITAAQRRQGGLIGGQLAAERRRRESAKRKAAEIEQFINAAMRTALDRHELARLRVGMTRAFWHGYKLGRHSAWRLKKKAA